MKSSSLSPSEPHTDSDPRCPVCGSPDFQRHLSYDADDVITRTVKGRTTRDPLGIDKCLCTCGYAWKDTHIEEDCPEAETLKALAERKAIEAEKKRREDAEEKSDDYDD